MDIYCVVWLGLCKKFLFLPFLDINAIYYLLKDFETQCVVNRTKDSSYYLNF